jgi:protein TonB
MNAASHRRLAGALAISIALHLLVILPLRLPFERPAHGVQVTLQATLARTPPAEITPAKPGVPPGKKTPLPPARQLSAPREAGLAAAAALPPAPPAPPAAEERSAGPADALVLEQPLLPEYPANALARGLEGCVLASVQVNAGGEVESVTILAADHPGVFDAAVIEAQMSARYAPALQGSEAIASRVLAVAAFVLQPGKQLDCPLKYAAQAERLVRRGTP